MYYWRIFAEIVNSILNEILLSWNNETYLFYNVFASTQPIAHSISYTIAGINVAKGLMLSSVACWSEARQKTFVSRFVAP